MYLNDSCLYEEFECVIIFIQENPDIIMSLHGKVKMNLFTTVVLKALVSGFSLPDKSC